MGSGANRLREASSNPLAWLHADPAAWTGLAHSDRPADRANLATAVAHWLDDADLAGVRPGDTKVDLTADERPAWESFWADVRSTLRAAKKPVSPPVPAPAPAAKP